MSLQETDTAAAAVQKTPNRVALSDIEAKVKQKIIRTADNFFDVPSSSPDELKVLTLCILVLRNGFTVVGKSAPADPENFNAELGEKFAYEDAIRQLWPLCGFALREKLSEES